MGENVFNDCTDKKLDRKMQQRNKLDNKLQDLIDECIGKKFDRKLQQRGKLNIGLKDLLKHIFYNLVEPSEVSNFLSHSLKPPVVFLFCSKKSFVAKYAEKHNIPHSSQRMLTLYRPLYRLNHFLEEKKNTIFLIKKILFWLVIFALSIVLSFWLKKQEKI